MTPGWQNYDTEVMIRLCPCVDNSPHFTARPLNRAAVSLGSVSATFHDLPSRESSATLGLDLIRALNGEGSAHWGAGQVKAEPETDKKPHTPAKMERNLLAAAVNIVRNGSRGHCQKF